ncbi:MAG TPA: hypothetical protein VK763_11265 [Terriglobales bacterium]|nr:hypothetical protein [Terriglobales bacterium]
MTDGLVEYYNLPESLVGIVQQGESKIGNGYFRFGTEICYGQCAGLNLVSTLNGSLADALPGTSSQNGTVSLPFDLAQVADNLRNERYVRRSILNSTTAAAYYLVRPLLPVAVRKHLQKTLLMNWDKLTFPHWPVDFTVDNLFERSMLLVLRSRGLDRIPFVWFWPEGTSSCAIMTHDVETTAGRDFCSSLMDIDDRFGIKASFQVVPERRYDVPASYINEIRGRGFEINVQDLNHDGRLFRDRKEFLTRVPKINAYGRQWGARGFRSAILYRRQEWFYSLEFSYDMSVPNVAHLDPQRGGCCTVMPYFVGDVLELPVTATQDYSLFHILNDYTIDLWKRQIGLIMERHGLISFIVHPDYIIGPRARRTYEELLTYLAQLRGERNIWMPTPGEVDHWWRQRAQMRLVADGDYWRIEGSGKERARIAYASEENGRLVLSLQGANRAMDTPVRK